MERRLLLFALLTVTALGAGAQEAALSELPADQVTAEPRVTVDVDELRVEVQKILDENKVPGASIALVDRDQTLWAGGVGMADVAAGTEVTGDHLFRVGSISKSFTALGVLRAVEDGLVDLDWLVREAAPEVEFSNPWADSHPVTVAMVMEHTAGFDDIHFREYAKVDDPDLTLEAGLAYNPRSRASRWPPGTLMSYCNSGPPIAAYIVQKSVGKDFEDYVQEQVFDPLGMSSATFLLPEGTPRMAKGYEGDGVTVAHYDHIIIRPSGALNASARDMARYLRMMINRGTLDGVEIVRPETLDRMETPTTTLAARAGFDFGYGLGNYASIVNGHRFQGHNGGITGFASTSAYSSELGVGFFVSVNRPSGKALRGIAELVGERLTAGAPKPTPPVLELDESRSREIAGFYQDVTPRQELMYFLTRFLGSVQRVSVEEGSLHIKGLLGGETKQLIPVTESSFRFEDQGEATMFIVADEKGRPVFVQGLGTNSRRVSGGWVLFQYASGIVVALLLLSALLFALVWAPLKPFGKLRRVPLRIVLIPFLAALSPLVAFVLPVLVTSDFAQAFGTLSPASLTLFLGSLAFVVLTLLSVYTVYRAYGTPMSRGARLHATLVTAACSVALVYLWAHGLIGLRTWVY